MTVQQRRKRARRKAAQPRLRVSYYCGAYINAHSEAECMAEGEATIDLSAEDWEAGYGWMNCPRCDSLIENGFGLDRLA